MDTGIGLPAMLPGMSRGLALDWAKRADAGPFSSLGVTDRIVYPNLEPLVTLAFAAAVTHRIRLLTGVLVVPLRNAGIVAKQVASIDALSRGRLTLGLGIGGREDDYRAAPAVFRHRGRHFEAQLAVMQRIWSGQPPIAGAGPVGPPPGQAGGPKVLIAALTPTAARRVGRWADGFLASPGSRDRALALYRIAEEAWQAEGRPGRPRFVGGIFYALGPNAADTGSANLRDYYAFMGARDGISVAEYVPRILVTAPAAVQDALQAARDLGMDEFIFWPAVPHLEQLDRLRELIG